MNVIKNNSHSRKSVSGIFNACSYVREQQTTCVEDPRLQASGMTTHWITSCGFTLIELLVVVLIIGILAAVAVPQYQKAVLKSRFSAMMPIGKAIAEGNEVYYMEHGSYASLPTQLDVSGQSSKYPDGTQVSIPQEEESLSYVLVTNDSVPNARYLVYQKHSPNFADTTMCEAGDTRANELCQALGGQPVVGGGNSLGSTEWTAYLLTGNQGSSSFIPPCPEGSVCNEVGTVTRCAPGYYKSGDSCIPQPTRYGDCTVTSYKDTSCANQNYALGRRCYAFSRGCQGSSFSGESAFCYAYDVEGCKNTTYTQGAYCRGDRVDGCVGATFYGGSYCQIGASRACDNTTYLPNEQGVLGCCINGSSYSCPVGVPICTSVGNTPNGWQGECCNPEAVGGIVNCGSTPTC